MNSCTRFPNELISLFVFGSHARGDADSYSDRDLCLFTDDLEYTRLLGVRHEVARTFDVSVLEVSGYPKAVVYQMAAKGSLFLWHLRLEGRILHDRDNFARDLLASLAPFSHYRNDLGVFRSLLNGISRGYARPLPATEFDLHMLQSIVRNTCILLTYAAGRPTFDRKTAFTVAVSLYPQLPMRITEYEELCKWHLCYVRGVAPGRLIPDESETARLIDAVGAVITFAEEILI